jgi:hypothetical protein
VVAQAFRGGVGDVGQPYCAGAADPLVGTPVVQVVQEPDAPHDADRGGQLADEPEERVEAQASGESHRTAPVIALPDCGQVAGLEKLRPGVPVDVEQRAGPYDDVVEYGIVGQLRVVEPSQPGRDPLVQ